MQLYQVGEKIIIPDTITGKNSRYAVGRPAFVTRVYEDEFTHEKMYEVKVCAGPLDDFQAVKKLFHSVWDFSESEMPPRTTKRMWKFEELEMVTGLTLYDEATKAYLEMDKGIVLGVEVLSNGDVEYSVCCNKVDNPRQEEFFVKKNVMFSYLTLLQSSLSKENHSPQLCYCESRDLFFYGCKCGGK